LLACAGCAGRAPVPALPDVPELGDVPFFPQTEYDCGPAALATILNAAGVAATPRELIDAVYIEGLRGSLQAELLAATRRHGLLPVPLEPSASSLYAEIASGRPVLVLQNKGFARAPVWHYAVVVGFDARRKRVILRSGTEKRRLERQSRFMRSWRLADNWAFVAAKPGQIPASGTPDLYMRALVGAAGQLDGDAAERAYEAALGRWPDDALVLFLSASAEHADGELAAAGELYRRALARQPDHVAARNNLANVLLEQGCRQEALREARAALRLLDPENPFRAAVADTMSQIESAPAAGSSEPSGCGGP
jgi:tetratricopeptide (TPR) repeat protein